MKSIAHINTIRNFLLDNIFDNDDLDKMYNQLLEWHNRIDVLVNNAGVADFGNLEETNFKKWNEVMKTNLHGVFLCSQKAIIHLKKTKKKEELTIFPTSPPTCLLVEIQTCFLHPLIELSSSSTCC